MTPSLKDLGIEKLSIEEKLELANAIHESVAKEIENSPLTDAQKAELDRRISDMDANPDGDIPWETIRDEARARRRR
jgi:putative addiction module component (TIGR02574 family)